MKVSPSIKPFDPAADPAAAGVSVPPRRPSKLARTLRKWRGFLLAVVLPTALTAGYLYGIAAGQFASEARFLVRGASGSSGGASSSAMSMALGNAGFKPAQDEAMAVRDYLLSQDAVRELRKTLDLVAIWRRPEADPVARLMDDQPSIERLTRYYRRMVAVEFDTEASTVSVQVRAFRPEDARAVAEGMLRIAEGLVNSLSERQRGNTLADARREVQIAEERVIAALEALKGFRQTGNALDPASEATGNMTNVVAMEGALAQARAELREKSSYMRADNPQITNVRNRISALEGQIANERQRLTTGAQAVPGQLATYERLMLEREFADKQLATAVSAQESSRVDTLRQQLYVARVTQPQLAETAQYPRAAFITGSVFAVLCVVYGIASLVFAGFREHAA